MYKNNTTLSDLLELEEDELFYQMGLELSQQTENISNPLKKRKPIIDFAKKWYTKNIINIKKSICTSEIVILYKANPEKISDIELISTIGDMLLNSWSLPAPLLISVLIFKSGINNLCE